MTEDMIKVNTLHFGDMEVEPSHVFDFTDGMLGFEELKRFVLVSHQDYDPFKWLISLDNPDIGFPLLDPFFLDEGYRAGRDIDYENEVVFTVVTLGGMDATMTANLKAPVILNIGSRNGRQIILTSDKYSPTYEIKIK